VTGRADRSRRGIELEGSRGFLNPSWEAGMRQWIRGGALVALMAAPGAQAAEITLSCGWQALEVQLCEEAAAAWSAESGHTVTVIRGPEQSNQRCFEYLDLLSRGDRSVDILPIDVIWPSALADQLVDLSGYVPAGVISEHFPAILENNTVAGRLVAVPWFTDAGMLFYREDLLARYGIEVPQTWSELADAALLIQAGERAAGNDDFWGLVFEGRAYEGLTCNALEWISAAGGGRIVDDDGTVTVNNPAAALALARAAAWVGTVAPPRVTQFVEEDARITFQLGNAAFMRNWPYAWALLNGEDSALRGKVGVAPLPKGSRFGRHAATLGGWQLAVSRHSANKDAAIDFVLYLTDAAEQKRRAIAGSFAPTIPSLYRDPEVLAANPFFVELGEVLAAAVARPSAQTGGQYAQVSTLFWEAAHNTLIGNGSALSNLAWLEDRLELLRSRAGW
jgi:trehalose/maltose transport system substrate-binding protein